MNRSMISGPAFPQPCTDSGNRSTSPYEMAGGGLSIRDYFAAKALQGMASKDGSPCYEYEAEAAYKYADAMLKARNA